MDKEGQLALVHLLDDKFKNDYPQHRFLLDQPIGRAVRINFRNIFNEAEPKMAFLIDFGTGGFPNIGSIDFCIDNGKRLKTVLSTIDVDVDQQKVKEFCNRALYIRYKRENALKELAAYRAKQEKTIQKRLKTKRKKNAKK